MYRRCRNQGLKDLVIQNQPYVTNDRASRPAKRNKSVKLMPRHANRSQKIDTSEQARASGQPRDRAASCDARRGRLDARRQWSCGGPAAKDNIKAH
ncbi:MAG: hypothetical protein ABR985_21010 [Methanotrichaceae archaeon]